VGSGAGARKNVAGVAFRLIRAQRPAHIPGSGAELESRPTLRAHATPFRAAPAQPWSHDPRHNSADSHRSGNDDRADTDHRSPPERISV